MKNQLLKLKKFSIEAFQENKSKLFKQMAFMAFMFGVFTLAGVTSFADETPTAVITTDMLSPIVKAVSSNLAVILPVGMGIMGTFIGVKLIPKIIYKFL